MTSPEWSLRPGEKHPPWPNEPSVEICIEQCESKCCRTPNLFLELMPEEENLFDGYPIRNSIKIQDAKGITYKKDGRFLWFADTHGRCPHLDYQGYCGIYEDRPNGCRMFPHEPVAGCLVWPVPWPKTLTPLPPPREGEGESWFPFGKLAK